MPAPRFKNFIRRADRTAPPNGAWRGGVHGDLAAVLDPESQEAAKVSVDFPAVMIRTIKYVGASEGKSTAEAMGVKAHALYEFLMASARLELANETTFLVPFADLKKYLQVDRSDRIREYMDAVNQTLVSYDFTERDGARTIGRKIQLMSCRERIMPDGKSYIKYSMPDDVRTVILAAKSYTWKELAAFALFTSKYAARLYPILAYRAGMSFEKPCPLVIDIPTLAAQLGWAYEPGKFKFSHFEARCLLPALADIKAHVKRFQVLEYKPLAAETRGRPITHISFTVSQAEKFLEERQKAEVTAAQMRILPALLARRGIDMNTEVPAVDTLARAATILGVDVIEVGTRWADVLEHARRAPELAFGRIGEGVGRDIVDLMEARGVGAAFALWLTDPEARDPLSASAPKAGNDESSQSVEDLFPEEESKSHLEDYLKSILAA
jgi:hypothetical protein